MRVGSTADHLVPEFAPETLARFTDRNLFHFSVLLEQLALFLIQFRRNDQLHDDNHVPTIPTSEVWQSGTRDLEDLAVLSPCWYLEFHDIIQTLDLDGGSKSSLCKGHWLNPDELIAISLEEIMWKHSHHYMKISAHSRTIQALFRWGRLAFSLNSDHLTIADSSWDLYLKVSGE